MRHDHGITLREAPAPPAAAPDGPVSGELAAAAASASGCDADVDATSLALSATYWFEVPEAGFPGPVDIGFEGHRLETSGTEDPHDRFSRVERVTEIPPGSGRVTVTTRVAEINGGQWRVIAGPVRGRERRSAGSSSAAGGPRPMTAQTSVCRTRLAPLVHSPGTHPFLWTVLVLTGALAAVALQGLLTARAGGDVPLPVRLC